MRTKHIQDINDVHIIWIYTYVTHQTKWNQNSICINYFKYYLITFIIAYSNYTDVCLIVDYILWGSVLKGLASNLVKRLYTFSCPKPWWKNPHIFVSFLPIVIIQWKHQWFPHSNNTNELAIKVALNWTQIIIQDTNLIEEYINHIQSIEHFTIIIFL